MIVVYAGVLWALCGFAVGALFWGVFEEASLGDLIRVFLF